MNRFYLGIVIGSISTLIVILSTYTSRVVPQAVEYYMEYRSNYKVDTIYHLNPAGDTINMKFTVEPI